MKRFKTMLFLLLVLIVVLALVRLGLQAIAFVHPPRFATNLTPSNYNVSTWRDVSFETSDGLTLNGWYVPPQRADGASLLTVHGLGGSRKVFLPELDFLHNSGGYGALLFDLRNHGTSDGDVTTMSNTEILDVQAAYAFLAAQPEVGDNIVLTGKSMGGAIAIRSMEALPEARGLIVDTAYTSIEDVTRDGIANLGIPPLFFHHVILGLSNLMSGSNLYEARPIDSIASIAPRPVLFIHGTADRTIPVEHIYTLHEAASEPKDLLIVEGADHIMAYTVAPEVYEQRTLDFLSGIFGEA